MPDISSLSLTERESEVAYLLVGGKSRDDICTLLNLALGTLNTYCTRIYKKTGCSSREELIGLFEEK